MTLVKFVMMISIIIIAVRAQSQNQREPILSLSAADVNLIVLISLSTSTAVILSLMLVVLCAVIYRKQKKDNLQKKQDEEWPKTVVKAVQEQERKKKQGEKSNTIAPATRAPIKHLSSGVNPAPFSCRVPNVVKKQPSSSQVQCYGQFMPHTCVPTFHNVGHQPCHYGSPVTNPIFRSGKKRFKQYVLKCISNLKRNFEK